jgi:protein-L-isoaspartate(D-aspartate) O-methyltransferase
MKIVPREEFLPLNLRSQAYVDCPLPIGEGQTISAPHMVSIMNEELHLEVGHRVLEVGAGCGYHACTVAEVVAPSDVEKSGWGHVYTVEIIEALVQRARGNVERTGYADRVTAVLGDGGEGLPSSAPFDRIYVTAAAPDVPKPLIEQLKPGGVLLVPVGEPRFFQYLVKVVKSRDGAILRSNLGGVSFVPLVGKEGFRGWLI